MKTKFLFLFLFGGLLWGLGRKPEKNKIYRTYVFYLEVMCHLIYMG